MSVGFLLTYFSVDPSFLPYCWTARQQSAAEEVKSPLYSLPILYWCHSNHRGQSTNPLTLCFALSNGFMSALKSCSHPEAPARLALSFIFLPIDCLCVLDAFICLHFLHSSCESTLICNCHFTPDLFSLSPSFCLQGSIIPLTSFPWLLPFMKAVLRGQKKGKEAKLPQDCWLCVIKIPSSYSHG